MATSPFLPSFIDHPNDLRSEEIVNYNQHKELGAATLSASSLGKLANISFDFFDFLIILKKFIT